jgi:hypothetical protein
MLPELPATQGPIALHNWPQLHHLSKGVQTSTIRSLLIHDQSSIIFPSNRFRMVEESGRSKIGVGGKRNHAHW